MQQALALYPKRSNVLWGFFSEKTSLLVPKETVSLALLLITLQVLDGMFTLAGIHAHGLQIEGNILIRTLMQMWGAELAVVVVKSFAIIVTIILSVMSLRVHWLPRALRLVAAIYLLCAILPWSAIILFA